MPEYRNDLASSQTGIADVHRSRARFSEARAGYERAIATREALVKASPTNKTFRSGLASATRRLGLTRGAAGDTAGAAAHARRGGLPSTTACLRGRPRTGSRQPAVTPPSQAGPGRGLGRNGNSEAEVAMAQLARAVAMGYRDPRVYHTESALDPLRNRPDFRLLMLDLTFPSEPFAPRARGAGLLRLPRRSFREARNGAIRVFKAAEHVGTPAIPPIYAAGGFPCSPFPPALLPPGHGV